MQVKAIRSAIEKASHLVTVILAIALLLACAACSTDASGSTKPSDKGSETTRSSAPADPTPKEDDHTEGGNEDEPAGEDAREAALAYQTILENHKGGVLQACIQDICGDGKPELLFIREVSDEIQELIVYTFTDGASKEILKETIVDETEDISPENYGVMTTGAGELYIMLLHYEKEWDYEIYYGYTFKEDRQTYVEYSFTSSNVLKYVSGFDIFDGYSTGGWDDIEAFKEQVSKLHAKAEHFIFTNCWYPNEPRDPTQIVAFGVPDHAVLLGVSYDDAITQIAEMTR